jgi:hypothetical protein
VKYQLIANVLQHTRQLAIPNVQHVGYGPFDARAGDLGQQVHDRLEAWPRAVDVDQPAALRLSWIARASSQQSSVIPAVSFASFATWLS